MFSEYSSKDNIIDNHKLEELYNNTFEKGRFFKVLFPDENSFNIQLSPKIYMQVTYLPNRDNIDGFEIIKLNDGKVVEKISFSKFNFAQLESFLKLISDLDLSTISERRIKLADNSLDILDEATKKKITTLLHGNEGAEIIQQLLDNEIIDSQDIVNTGYRKKQLRIFKKLLDDEGYIDEYKKSESTKTFIEAKENIKTINENSKNEIAWQYFFEKNAWIFGYGLDYRFQNILQREFSASDTDGAGKEQVNADFLIGDNHYTTFVELKTPDTELFTNVKNRSNSWCLSSNLTYAVSQILEQKASGQIKLEGIIHDSLGEIISQKSYDSKCVLIIGNLENEIKKTDDSAKIRQIKKKTFELFRRNSRNIEIITFDELYDRASYIVNNNNSKSNSK
jgi:hypothetical protein